ncbi:MAG TPA: cupin, partial [Verrucomicrobiales bacterium]|nr:cupin [Verrucomicrobiales bacterium]
EDLEFYVISDNPVADDCHYPDSNKVAVMTLPKVFRPQYTDYYDGEE